MRILLLSNLYPPHVQGGAEILAGEIASGLERLGHEVVVLSSWYGLPEGQQDGRTWRTLHNASAVHFDKHRPVWRQLNLLSTYYCQFHNARNMQELHHVITATKPDVLYIWEITGIGINSLLSELTKLTMPIVFHLGSYWLQYAISPQTEHSRLHLRWFKKLLIGSVPQMTYTSLIAVSESVKQEYVQMGCDPERIEVIYNGIDSRFLELPKPTKTEGLSVSRDFQLLYAGRLRVEKGVIVILKALDVLLNEMGKQGFHLNIFGDGDDVYIGELQAFLSEKQLSQAVTIHGKVPQDELIRHYDDSDIMLVPSLWKEPFGLVVAEGMARGLPVIASDIGGPAEIILHGENGLLIEPGNERALASAILQLSEKPEERKRLSQAARTTVRKHFTIEESARRVQQHLLRAVQVEQVTAS